MKVHSRVGGMKMQEDNWAAASSVNVEENICKSHAIWTLGQEIERRSVKINNSSTKGGFRGGRFGVVSEVYTGARAKVAGAL